MLKVLNINIQIVKDLDLRITDNDKLKYRGLYG